MNKPLAAGALAALLLTGTPVAQGSSLRPDQA